MGVAGNRETAKLPLLVLNRPLQVLNHTSCFLHSLANYSNPTSLDKLTLNLIWIGIGIRENGTEVIKYSHEFALSSQHRVVVRIVMLGCLAMAGFAGCKT